MIKYASVALLPLFFLTACVDTTGLSADSSRGPRGNPAAAVTVEEFADFQCPACRSAVSLITTPLLERYGKDVRFVYRHFPLRSIHRFALDVAEGAECAADQGKFWEFGDLAFERQPDLNKEAILVWAEVLKLDMGLFQRCMDSDIKKETILADFDEGKERGVTGTPTFFVNGKRVENGIKEISDAIDDALAGTMQRL